MEANREMRSGLNLSVNVLAHRSGVGLCTIFNYSLVKYSLTNDIWDIISGTYGPGFFCFLLGSHFKDALMNVVSRRRMRTGVIFPSSAMASSTPPLVPPRWRPPHCLSIVEVGGKSLTLLSSS